MEVKDFSEKIVEVAENNVGGSITGRFKTYATAYASIVISSALTDSFSKNPIYFLSGAVSYLVSKVPDVISTRKLVKLSKDPRFKEYGLNNHYFESCPALPDNPSMQDLYSKKQIVIQTLVGVLSTVFPPIGHGALVTEPIFYKNNTNIKNWIDKEFEIGDDVKEMIAGRASKEEIDLHLDSLIKREPKS